MFDTLYIQRGSSGVLIAQIYVNAVEFFPVSMLTENNFGKIVTASFGTNHNLTYTRMAKFETIMEKNPNCILSSHSLNYEYRNCNIQKWNLTEDAFIIVWHGYRFPTPNKEDKNFWKKEGF